MEWLSPGLVMLSWLVGGALLAWPRLPEPWRRAVALALSAAGLVCLTAGMRTEGVRETPTLTRFLVGPPDELSRVSASASLHYYVLTVVCLALGALGLVAGERTLERLRARPWAWACALTGAVALLRLALEQAAAPLDLVRLFGVTWLAPVAGAFLAAALPTSGSTLRLVRALAGYGLATRGFLVALYAAATGLGWGSHFDLSRVEAIVRPYDGARLAVPAGRLERLLLLAVVPQLGFWVIYTVAAGMLGAWLWGLVRSRARTA